VLIAELLGVFFTRVSEDDPAAVVDHRAHTVRVERGGDVFRRSPLATEARDKEPCVRHRGAELSELLRIGRPDDRPGKAVAGLAGSLRRKLLY
jgi:hypothetical protein